MRRYKQGSLIRVTVSEREVYAFAHRWPCFGRIAPLSFTFDSNGDLVDLTGNRDMDGAGVSALADNARKYAWLNC